MFFCTLGGILAKSLANLSAQTRTYLDEAAQADWTDTEVTREINAKYMEIYTAIVGVFEDYYSVKSQTASVANQEEYALPSDCYKVRRIEISYSPSDSSDIPRRALPVSMDSVLRDLGNSSLGITVYKNPSYYIRGTTVGIIPAPTQAGSTAITLWYIKNISELSATTDTIDIPFPDRYGQLISLGAAATLLRKGQQEELVASKYFADYENGKVKMMEELEDRLADGNKQIVDTAGEDLDFGAPGYF